MTYEEFEPTIIKLQNVYGPKAFPAERVEVIYKAVKYVPLPVWKETLNELIGEAIHVPSLSKIKEILNVVRKRMGDSADPWQSIRDEIRELEKTSQCGRCFGQGVFYAYYRNDPHQFMYTFTCTCAAGHLARKLPDNARCYEWTYEVAEKMRYDFEPEGHQPRPSRETARAAVAKVFQSKDLNAVIGEEPAPKRGYEDEKWEAEL